MNIRAIVFCVLCLFGSVLQAHSVGESYLFLTADDRHLEVEIQIRLEELTKVLNKAELVQGEVEMDDVDANLEWLRSYILKGVSIRGGGESYPLQFDKYKPMDTYVGVFVLFTLSAQAVNPFPDVLEVDYSLVFEADPNHKALILVRYSDQTNLTNFTDHVALTFDADDHIDLLDLTESVHLEVFWKFISEGIRHIIKGLDHVLFLVALILLSVVRQKEKRWTPVTTFKPAFINIIKVVTLFTVAHTITLSLATLGYVQISSRFVESIIAASVAFVAINALYPMVSERIWTLVFGFGLFHGLGFAGSLEFLGLARGSLLYPLAGFNIGVEAGQLALIVVTFPIIYAISRKTYYVKAVMRPVSSLVAVIALLWLTERTLDIKGLVPG